MRISKSNLFLFLYEIFFFGVMTICYLDVIIPYWGYLGFKNNFTEQSCFIGLLIVVLMTALGLNLKSNFISTVWHFVLTYLFYPQVIYYFSSSNNFLPVGGYIILLIVLFLVIKLPLPLLALPKFNIERSKKNFFVVFWGSSLLVFPYLIYIKHVNFSNLLLSNIYDTRLSFRDVSKPGVLNYLLSPLSRVILPSLLVVSLLTKRFIYAGLCFVFVAYLFLSNGALKSIFLGFFAVIFFYLGSTFLRKLFLFISLITLLCFLSIAEYQLYGTGFLSDMAIRRVFFVPPYFEDLYYRYFIDHDFTYYTHSFFSFLKPGESDLSLSRKMGKYFSGDEDLNANIGIIPDGFLSIGWIGVILHSIIFSLSFKIFNNINVGKDYFGLFFVYIYYANTAFIGTFFISHAFLFLLIFVYIFLNNKNKSITNTIYE